MYLNFNKITFLILTAVAFSCFSCGNKPSPCAQKTFSEEEIIDCYHRAYFPENQTVDKKFAIYLDYSGSVKTAFKDFNTQNFYQLFINSLKISEVDFYEVNNFSIDKIDGLQTSELYEKIKNADKFKGDNAPLNKAVRQIIEDNSEAVFITDGELWEKGERDDPWAREEFEKWLKDGNRLEFFVTDHLDGGNKQHLFYICFVPKNSKSTVISDFKFYLANSGAAKSMKYSNFCFSNSDVKFLKDGYRLKTGGLNENTFMDESVYKNFENFEYISLLSKWNDLFKYITNAYEQSGKPLKNGAPLLSRLKIDLSGLEFYKVGKVVLKTYNISDDFYKFKKIREIKENTPVFYTENGEIVLDENRQKILVCSGDTEGYNDKGELVADTVFKTAKRLNTVEKLFVQDDESFIKNPDNELCVKLSQNFSGSLSETESNILRIDVVLKDVKVNTENINIENFVWQGKQVKENRSMYNSVLGALNAANPEGKTVYTFYIKTLPYKN
jgi:hypothetical protein